MGIVPIGLSCYNAEGLCRVGMDNNGQRHLTLKGLDMTKFYVLLMFGESHRMVCSEVYQFECQDAESAIENAKNNSTRKAAILFAYASESLAECFQQGEKIVASGMYDDGVKMWNAGR